jgi:hypothetical protein
MCSQAIATQYQCCAQALSSMLRMGYALALSQQVH